VQSTISVLMGAVRRQGNLSKCFRNNFSIGSKSQRCRPSYICKFLLFLLTLKGPHVPSQSQEALLIWGYGEESGTLRFSRQWGNEIKFKIAIRR
jgi:hypothetical protein